MNNQFTEKVGKISNKLSQNKIIKGLSSGVMATLPLIIIGAFASLLVGLKIPAWQTFIASNGIAATLNMVVNATTNSLGMLVSITAASAFAEEYGVKNKQIGLFSLMFYMILLPTYLMKKGMKAFLSYDYLGASGMITALIVAWIVVRVYKFVAIDHKWTIKMPKGTPPYVSNTFTSLIPGFVLAILAIIIRLICLMTPFKTAFDLIYFVLQTPLNVLVGNNIWSVAFIYLISGLLWFFGIHPGFLQGMLAPILFQMDAQNQAAFAANKPIPHIIGFAFSYGTTIATFYAAFGIATLIFSKSKRLKTASRVAIIPALFGISEPMNFGFPVIYNVTLGIPYVLIPVFNEIIAYYLIKLGIVAPYAGVMITNMPFGVTGFLNGSISIAIMETCLVILDIIIAMPFIKAYDKTLIAQELEER